VKKQTNNTHLFSTDAITVFLKIKLYENISLCVLYIWSKKKTQSY